MLRTEVERLLGRISAAYGRRPATESQVAEWHRHLATHDAQRIILALDQHIAGGGPGPSVADLLAHVPGPRVYDGDGTEQRTEREPWCQCRNEAGARIICPEHCRIGLAAIAQIKNQGKPALRAVE
jgi:hypothetical protein